MYVLLTAGLCAAVKILGALEWPQLYRLFLYLPARVLAFFLSAGYREDRGTYIFPEFILDYSCSGIHFFIITALLAALQAKAGWRGWFTAIASAYLVTLAANTARVALFLKVGHLAVARPWLHEAIGTLVFITFLIGFYFLRRRYGMASAPASSWNII